VRTEEMKNDVVQEQVYLLKKIAEELGLQENLVELFNMDKTGLPTKKFPRK
jgi:hypothetical protein